MFGRDAADSLRTKNGAPAAASACRRDIVIMPRSIQKSGAFHVFNGTVPLDRGPTPRRPSRVARLARGDRSLTEAHSDGSLTSNTWFAFTPSSFWTVPLGQRTSISSTTSTGPRPK